jgi:protoporphyrinogen oxidase
MGTGKVIVIGAGIGGLSAAYWLTQRGYEVEILEASDRPGGRMVTLEHKGDRVDVGAQFYHSSYRHAFDLMDAVNLSGAKRDIKGNIQFSLKDGSTFSYNHKTPYMKVLGLRGNLKLYGFILRHIFLRHRFPMHQIVEDRPEYDNMEALDFFGHPKDQALRDFVVTPVSLADNLGLPEFLNVYHFIHTFRISTFTTFIALTRGVASLAEELARRLPVNYESPVRQLVMEEDRVVGVQIDGDGSVERAGHVIVAVTPPAAARVLPDDLDEQRSFFESVTYGPFPMPVFFLDRPLRRDIWCYFSDPGLRRTFTFALDETSKIPEMVPSGKSIVAGFSGHPMTLDLIDQKDEEIIATATGDIELMIPGFSNYIDHATVFRHSYGVARYPTRSYRRVLDFKRGARRLQGVSFVSDLFGGSYMEPAMSSAAEAVTRVCEWGGTA